MSNEDTNTNERVTDVGKWYKVGSVNCFSERYFAACCLAASFEREQWRWGLGTHFGLGRKRLPSALEVQSCIDQMISNLAQGAGTALQTGGLRITKESGAGEDNGLFVLYCDVVLKPTVTMKELEETKSKEIREMNTNDKETV